MARCIRPERSAGGYRLYSEDDEIRVRRMLAHLEGGLAAAQHMTLSIYMEPAALLVVTVPERAGRLGRWLRKGKLGAGGV